MVIPGDPVDPRNDCLMKFKIFSAGLGMILGVSVFFVFTFQLQNYHAGLWALLSFCLSTIVLHQHFLYRNYRLEEWHTVASLTSLRNLGILTLLSSTGATIYYFYFVIAEHQPLYPLKDSYMLGGVWSFMSWKWSVMTIFFSQKYKKILDREYTLF